MAVASCRGHLPIVQLLLESGPDVTAKSYFGPYRRDPVVHLLLQNNADVNANDVSGRSALHWAAENHQTGPVEILIDNGANVTLPDGFGRTPAHRAAANGSRALSAPLGAATDMKDKIGRTPLHLAAANSKSRSVNLLIMFGADVSKIGRAHV